MTISFECNLSSLLYFLFIQSRQGVIGRWMFDVHLLSLSQDLLEFLRQCSKRKWFLDKILSTCIQDLPGWPIYGISAENNHLKVRAGFYDKRIDLSAFHLKQFYIQQSKVDVSIKGYMDSVFSSVGYL